MTTGSRMPNFQTPMHWISVAMPQANRSALIRNAIWSLGSLSAPPRISGTAIAPAYITSTCCRPTANICPNGSTWSTGCTASLVVFMCSPLKSALPPHYSPRRRQPCCRRAPENSAIEHCCQAQPGYSRDLRQRLGELGGTVVFEPRREMLDDRSAIELLHRDDERKSEFRLVSAVECGQPRKFLRRALA